MFAVERIFHPVGQGAFYTERIAVDDKSSPSGKRIFNIVYDCGTSSRQKFLDSEIGRSYRDGSTIDLMFISHLDEDHINGMDKLRKKNIEIKCLVLPLLDKSRYWFYFLESGINLYQTDALKHYFNTKYIIFTSPFNGGSRPLSNNGNNGNDTFDIDVECLGESEITRPSGYKIGFGSVPFWCYIPFNFAFDERYKLFIDNLEKEDKALYTEIMDEMSDKSLIIDDKSKLKKLKNVYDKLTKRNNSSLMVYSGPCSPEKHKWKHKVSSYDTSFIHSESSHKYRSKFISRIGALYTGDIDLNQSISDVVPRLKKSLIKHVSVDCIGTIQIPHHGAFKNFSSKLLTDFLMGLYYFVSYGTLNKFGHPFPGLSFDIQINDKFLLEVTEQRATGIKQIIYHR